MERRTVLAFALIFLVLVGYQILMSRVAPPPRPAEGVQDTTTGAESTAGGRGPVAATDDPSERPSTPPRRGAEPGPEPEPRAAPGLDSLESALTPVDAPMIEPTVTVRTPLYELTIAGSGARIVDWRGLAYLDDEGEPVAILPDDPHGEASGLEAVAFNAADLELDRLVFATDAPAQLGLNEGRRDVTFRVRTRGDLEIRKTYIFDADSYRIELDLEVATVGPQAPTALAMLGRPQQARFGWPQGIASTEGGDRLETAAFRSFAKVDDDLHFKKRGGELKDVEDVRGVYAGLVRFAGVQNKYFTVVGLPGRGESAQDGTVILSGDPGRNVQTWSMELPLTSVNTGADVLAASGITLYIGPQESDLLKAFGVGLDRTMELGWALFRPLTEATLWIMHQMRGFIPNWGVIIILFSVLTKIAFYPLTRTSTQSMKRMQQLQPKIKELQAKYKDNQEKQSKAMMELYQKEKVNPMAGCLPLLLQMPVFVALYQALAHTIALRNTPFVLWIDDLSQPDALFSLPFSLPFLGSDFNLLPLLMTASMVLQMRMTPTAGAGGQMAMMNTVMPVVFLFFFYQMPSGLVLYWLVNNLMTIYQTWRIHRTAGPDGGQQTA